MCFCEQGNYAQKHQKQNANETKRTRAEQKIKNKNKNKMIKNIRIMKNRNNKRIHSTNMHYERSYATMALIH